MLENYREQPTIEIKTELITEAQADARAELYAARFSNMPRIVPLIIMGIDSYTLRIYDVIEVELTLGFVNADTGEITGDREFFGVWKIQILGIDPNFNENEEGNNIAAYLIEKIEPVEEAMIAKDDIIFMFDDVYKWRVK